jgi:hypothetical protein
VDIRLGESDPPWPLVDRSFYPDQAALDAVARDLASPWAGPTVQTFGVRGQVWVRGVETPLDGTLTVHLTWPARIVLTGDTGQPMRPTLHRGRALSYQVCGERSVTVRVSSRNGTHKNTLRVLTP